MLAAHPREEEQMKRVLATLVALSLVVSMFTGVFAPVPEARAAGPAIVNLGTAGNFAILAKTAVTTTGITHVTGDIGISPALASDTAGFALIADSTNTFSTSSLVTGKVYAADYAPPTPANMTTAVGDMETAYTDAAGRPAGVGPNLNLGAGTVAGQTLVPGTYTWGTNVTITTDLTLSGSANDVWLFQITGTLDMATDTKVILSGGAQAANIFWQVSDAVTFYPGSHFEGNILAQTNIAMQTGATLNGRALAQSAVTLQANTVVVPTSVGGINPLPDSIGVFRPSTNGFYFRLSSGVSSPAYLGDSGDLPIIGDWDGNGIDDIGIFRPSTNGFYLKTGTTVAEPIFLGNLNDLPIIGDWNGDGRDEIGVFRPSTSAFYLRTGTTVAAPIYLGDSGDLPIIGDWNGDGTDEIGIFRPSNNGFYLRTGTTVAAPVYLGDSGDLPIIGDWDGIGADEIGIFRPSNNGFYLRTGTTVAAPVYLGNSGDKPIIGVWPQP